MRGCPSSLRAQLDYRNTNILLLYRPAAARSVLIYIYIYTHTFPPHNDGNTTVSQFCPDIFQNPSRITLSLINIDYVMSRHFHSSLPLPLYKIHIYTLECKCVRVPFLTLICRNVYTEKPWWPPRWTSFFHSLQIHFVARQERIISSAYHIPLSSYI